MSFAKPYPRPSAPDPGPNGSVVANWGRSPVATRTLVFPPSGWKAEPKEMQPLKTFLARDWVHGINKDVDICVTDFGCIYACGQLVIVFDEAESTQKYFEGHTSDITCIAYNKERNICVSGQNDPKGNAGPFLCVWSPEFPASGSFAECRYFVDKTDPKDIEITDNIKMTQGYVCFPERVLRAPVKESGLERVQYPMVVDGSSQVEAPLRKIQACAFTPDGRRVVAMGADDMNSLLVWDMAKIQNFNAKNPPLQTLVYRKPTVVVQTGRDAMQSMLMFNMTLSLEGADNDDAATKSVYSAKQNKSSASAAINKAAAARSSRMSSATRQSRSSASSGTNGNSATAKEMPPFRFLLWGANDKTSYFKNYEWRHTEFVTKVGVWGKYPKPKNINGAAYDLADGSGGSLCLIGDNGFFYTVKGANVLSATKIGSETPDSPAPFLGSIQYYKNSMFLVGGNSGTFYILKCTTSNPKTLDKIVLSVLPGSESAVEQLSKVKIMQGSIGQRLNGICDAVVYGCTNGNTFFRYFHKDAPETATGDQTQPVLTDELQAAGAAAAGNVKARNSTTGENKNSRPASRSAKSGQGQPGGGNKTTPSRPRSSASQAGARSSKSASQINQIPGRHLAILSLAHGGETKALAMHPTLPGVYITAGTDKVVQFWSSIERKPLVGKMLNMEKAVHSVAFDVSGKLLAVGMADGMVAVYDFPDALFQRILSDVKCENRGKEFGRMVGLRFSPLLNPSKADTIPPSAKYDRNREQAKSMFLACACSDNKIYLLKIKEVVTGEDIKSGQKQYGSQVSMHKQLIGHSTTPYCQMFSNDGQYLITNTRDGQIRVFHTISGQLQKSLMAFRDLQLQQPFTNLLAFETLGMWTSEYDLSILDTCCSFQNEHLAMGDDNGRIRLYKFPACYLNQPYNEYFGHGCGVAQVRFFEEQSLPVLISCGYVDKMIIQWRLCEPKDEVYAFQKIQYPWTSFSNGYGDVVDNMLGRAAASSSQRDRAPGAGGGRALADYMIPGPDGVPIVPFEGDQKLFQPPQEIDGDQQAASSASPPKLRGGRSPVVQHERRSTNAAAGGHHARVAQHHHQSSRGAAGHHEKATSSSSRKHHDHDHINLYTHDRREHYHPPHRMQQSFRYDTRADQPKPEPSRDPFTWRDEKRNGPKDDDQAAHRAGGGFDQGSVHSVPLREQHHQQHGMAGHQRGRSSRAGGAGPPMMYYQEPPDHAGRSASQLQPPPHYMLQNMQPAHANFFTAPPEELQQHSRNMVHFRTTGKTVHDDTTAHQDINQRLLHSPGKQSIGNQSSINGRGEVTSVYKYPENAPPNFGATRGGTPNGSKANHINQRQSAFQPGERATRQHQPHQGTMKNVTFGRARAAGADQHQIEQHRGDVEMQPLNTADQQVAEFFKITPDHNSNYRPAPGQPGQRSGGSKSAQTPAARRCKSIANKMRR
ncbi:unnamed protein product [Amoebophrya sp. A120]|nr:unnamed protein product [Amoebophrya sp. A120]|eukprot:GSA120T00007636001.1